MKTFLRLACSVVTVWMVTILSSGCRSVVMKGTPIYTGEYEKRLGPAEDRINVWPLVYYRDPALSVLWPIGEFTDDHWALRPVVSVYGLDTGRKEYNLFWPLAQYDTGNDTARVFPVFWGRHYLTVFPLYWHETSAVNKSYMFDTLFPAWWFKRDVLGVDAYIAWPLIHYKNRGNEKGWHLFPVAGDYTAGSSRYSFYAWPLGHAWANPDQSEAGSTFLPAYWYSRDKSGYRALSLPYSRGRDLDGYGWNLVPPLYYSTTDKHGSRSFTPLYSWGGSDDGRRSWSMFLPLYYENSDGDDKVFATLLGGRKRSRDGDGWLFPPLLTGGWRDSKGSSYWYPWPLGHSESSEAGSSQFFVPLYMRSSGRDGSSFYSAFWCRSALTNGTSWSLLAPLFYSRTTTRSSLFLSMPYSSGCEEDGSSWMLAPPFVFHETDLQSTKTVTPLYSWGGSSDGAGSWSLLLPLYYRSGDGRSSFFGSVLGGWERRDDRFSWLFVPGLLGGSSGKDGASAWYPWPLAHRERAGDSVTHFVLPAYYASSDASQKKFFSAVWSGGSHTNGSSWNLLVPLFYSMTNGADSMTVTPVYSHVRDERGTASFTPVAAWGGSRDGSNSWSTVLPVYYSSRKGDGGLFATLLGGARRDSTGSSWLIWPLLTGAASLGQSGYAYYPWPLGSCEWSKDTMSHSFLPVYSYSRDQSGYSLFTPLFYSMTNRNESLFLSPVYSQGGSKASGTEWSSYLIMFINGSEGVYTPLFGWNTNSVSGYFYPLTPLLGFRTGEKTSGFWLFPLLDWRADKSSDSLDVRFLWGNYTSGTRNTESGLFPFYGYRNHRESPGGGRFGIYGSDFWCLPICWYKNQKYFFAPGGNTAASGSPVVEERFEKRNGVFPLWSYSASETPAQNRKSIDGNFLWLLYDYHRERRSDASAEGGLTDYRRSRILWRLWHYENSDGDTAVDVFPAITYDSKRNGYTQFSFLWRLFRYERKAGGLNLDLLFIPIRRGESGGSVADEPVANDLGNDAKK
ncbi:MAG: hypothetical protein C0404_13655 [Verrucomicrobia bacterium]|nr:hypothetical protein [Verrucomicrobiota bacterium]